MGVVDDLAQAREAYERRDWMAAYDALSAAGPVALDGADYARLALAAEMLGRHNDCVHAMQRSYQLNVDAGDVLAAVRSAFWLAMTLADAGEPAVSRGWVSRAERLLQQIPDDVVERGYVWCAQLFGHIAAGEFEEAAVAAAAISDYGQRFRSDDLIAMGLCSQGRLTMYGGQMADGIRMLDEAMVAVASGELSPVFAGNVYCTAIEGYRRCPTTAGWLNGPWPWPRGAMRSRTWSCTSGSAPAPSRSDPPGPGCLGRRDRGVRPGHRALPPGRNAGGCGDRPGRARRHRAAL